MEIYLFALVTICVLIWTFKPFKRLKLQDPIKVRLLTTPEEDKEFARLYDVWYKDMKSASKRLECLTFGRALVSKYGEKHGLDIKNKQHRWRYDAENCFLEVWESNKPVDNKL